jgi:GTP cyclohydrolase I
MALNDDDDVLARLRAFRFDTAVKTILECIGEDPSREGLRETPSRVRKAWLHEWAAGYRVDAATVLKTFEDGAAGVDEMVAVTSIDLYSHCEHHIAPFFGVAHIAYIPNKRIVGLSKLARLVEVFSRRLQVQERLTNQIADALQEHLDPLGAGVIIQAKHFCMCSRGVRQGSAMTTTSALRGCIKEEPSARAEFLRLCGV